MRVTGIADFRHLQHERFVNMGAACRIQHDDIITTKLCGLLSALGNLHRGLALDDWQRIDARLLAKLTQLFLCCRTPNVERCHQHLLAIALRQSLGELGGGRRLAGALEAHHHDANWSGGCQRNGLCLFAEGGHQLVMNDLDDHLTRRHRFDDRCANSLLTDPIGELADHLKRHIRFDQRTANLPHGGRDVLVRQGTATGETVKYAAEAIGKRFKHGPCRCAVGDPTEIGTTCLQNHRRKCTRKKHPRAYNAGGW